jgi:hypothetical protein
MKATEKQLFKIRQKECCELWSVELRGNNTFYESHKETALQNKDKKGKVSCPDSLQEKTYNSLFSS